MAEVHNEDIVIALKTIEGYPFLPCPICHGIEGCDHSVPERVSAAILRANMALARREITFETLRPLLDDADLALDEETYEQKRKHGDTKFNKDDEYLVTAGTLQKINHLFSALDAILRLQEQPERKTENASV